MKARTKQKTGLQKFYGRREEFIAIIEKRSIMITSKASFHVMLLREIRNNGAQVADHAWIKVGDMEAQQFKRGDQIRFSAVVGVYKKNSTMNGKYKDFGFTDIVVMGGV